MKCSIIMAVIVLTIGVSGCFKNKEIRTPPWTENEIEEFQENDKKVVPVVNLKYD